MVNLEAKPVYNPAVEEKITQTIDMYSNKAFYSAFPIIFEGLQGFQAIIYSQGNNEQKLAQLPQYFLEYVQKHTTDKQELSLQISQLEWSADVIAKKIFSHLATKVGLLLTNPPETLQDAREALSNFIGLIGSQAGEDNTLSYIQALAIPQFQPLMDELRIEHSDDVLAQYPPVQE